MSHIALISEHASPLGMLGGADSGGQNVYVGQVARNLALLGHSVDVFTRRDNERLPEVAEWLNGVRLVHVPAGPPAPVRKEDLLPFMAAFTDYVLRFTKSRPRFYDLVHANFWMSGLVAADLKKALGIPFVITFHALGRVRRLHQGAADQFPEARFEIEDRIIAEADRIIAECRQDESDFLCLYQADPRKIVVIPCGFDPHEFAPMSKALARTVLGLRPDQRVLLQLGRIVPRKGIDNVIRGFALLRREYGIEARLLVVGGESDLPDPAATPEIGRLMAIAAQEQVSEAVQFVGRRGREALKHYYNAADLFLTTPHYEPFGITPLESMACGTGVIGSRVGGVKSTVVDGVTGFLVPPHDPAALASRMAHFYRTPELAQRFRQQAIRRANELFTWQRVTRSIEVVYRQVLGCRRERNRRETGVKEPKGFATETQRYREKNPDVLPSVPV